MDMNTLSCSQGSWTAEIHHLYGVCDGGSDDELESNTYVRRDGEEGGILAPTGRTILEMVKETVVRRQLREVVG